MTNFDLFLLQNDSVVYKVVRNGKNGRFNQQCEKEILGLILF